MFFLKMNVCRVVVCGAIFSGFATIETSQEVCADGKQHYRTTIRHIESGGIGYQDGYTTLEAFIASDPSRWVVTPFLDAKGHIFNNGKWAANVGVGARALWKNRVYGINTYYDYRNVGRFQSNQMGVGLETLGELLDFRMNGYFPVGVKISAPYDTLFDAFSGNYMLLSQKYQSAMKGADAEWGFHFGKSKSSRFYAAAGPYYFIGEKTPVTWGGKVRVMGTFKDIINLEISDSYDPTFHNKLQGQISLNFSFGPKSKVKAQGRTCKVANTLNDRMLQPVGRQEIVVVDQVEKNTVAIDPATGLPYFFVFVNNTSHSDGTYESPYHSFTQAQNNSSLNDIIYVFPGDGTTAGMDSGIFLKENQKLWGSGIAHALLTTQGVVSIPAQSGSSPLITNTDIDSEGNAITLADNNAISGLMITSPLNDAIYGTGLHSLEVSSCTMTSTLTYAIEATFSENASIAVTGNQFVDNVNGIFLTLNGTSTISCLNNSFIGQTSVSSIPLTVTADSCSFTAQVENNLFDTNTAGSMEFNLINAANTYINVVNNTVTNNGFGGSQGYSGSGVAILSTGTNEYCSLLLEGNTFSQNANDALFFGVNGSSAFTTLGVTAAENAFLNNQGGGLVFSTPVDNFTLTATDNTISGVGDNGIAVISSGVTSTGTINIKNNTITDVANNGINISQSFMNLKLKIQNNEIDQCAVSGILVYPNGTGIDYLAADISGNTISNCQNPGGSDNFASGIDIEEYTRLVGSIKNNTLFDNINLGPAVGVQSSMPASTTCMALSGNSSSTGYSLINQSTGSFNLSPCNVNSINSGAITTSGVTLIESCSNPVACPP